MIMLGEIVARWFRLLENCQKSRNMYSGRVHPKPKRQVDTRWLKEIRNQTCLVMYSPKATPCIGPVTPAHLRTRGAGGSDYTSVPLCVRHHGEQEDHTDQWFLENYGINLWKELSEILIRSITELDRQGIELPVVELWKSPSPFLPRLITNTEWEHSTVGRWHI
jgi:hypothetical protein